MDYELRKLKKYKVCSKMPFLALLGSLLELDVLLVKVKMQIKIRKGNELSEDIYIVSVPGTFIPVCSSFNKAEAVGELVLSHEFRNFLRVGFTIEIQDETGE